MAAYEAILRGRSIPGSEIGHRVERIAATARNAVAVKDDVEAVVRDVSAYVIAPALIGFCAWITAEAEARELRDLYFGSRDGQVLKDVVARLYGGSTGNGPHLHYLYGSRLTFRLATLAGFTDELVEWAFAPTSVLTARSVLSRCLLTTDDLDQTGAEVRRLRSHRCDQGLTSRDREALLQLIRTPRLRDLVEVRLGEHKKATIEYLRQEGLHRDGPWGFVDIGWHGKLHGWVASLVQDLGGGPSTGLFFGLEKAAGHPVDLENQFAYLFDNRVGKPTMDATEVIPVFEAFCSGDHGKVVGYARSSTNHIRPICRNGPSAELARLIRIIRKTVATAVEVTALTMRSDELRSSDYTQTVEALVRKFIYAPSRTEAGAWAAFPYDEDSAGAYARPLATPYTLADLWQTALTSSLPYRGGADWRSGSFAITREPIRTLVALSAVPRR